MEILQQMIAILVGGLQSFGTGLGTGIQNIIQALFVNVDSGTGAQTITIFATVVTVFAAIALAVGITRKIFGWLVTLGGRK